MLYPILENDETSFLPTVVGPNLTPLNFITTKKRMYLDYLIFSYKIEKKDERNYLP